MEYFKRGWNEWIDYLLGHDSKTRVRFLQTGEIRVDYGGSWIVTYRGKEGLPDIVARSKEPTWDLYQLLCGYAACTQATINKAFDAERNQ